MNKFWQDKHVFITGGSGFIGSWLTRHLVDLGAEVTLLYYDHKEPCELINSGYFKKVHIIDEGLEDPITLARILYEYRIDTVFHLGAQTQVQEAYLNPFVTYESNIRGTYSLLEACRIQGESIKRIIVASSDKAYGAHEALPYLESTSLRAKYPYDVSKACTDLIALSYYHTYGLPVAVTRCGNVYGGGDFNWERLIPSVIKSLYHEKSPILRSDGTALRDYIFVEDVVQAYLTLGEQLDIKNLQGEAFNFSGSEPTSVIQVVGLLTQLMNKTHLTPIIENNTQAEIPNQHLSAQKAWEKLGWKAYIPLKLGLSMTFDWYLQFFKEEDLVKKEVSLVMEYV